jgi:diguanylate cyclase (GGDEF)-like protein
LAVSLLSGPRLEALLARWSARQRPVDLELAAYLLGLRAKLSLALMAVIAPGFAVAGILVIEHNRTRLVGEVEVRASALLAAMAPPCSIALAQGEFEVLDGYVAHVSEAQRAAALELEYLMVLDHTGRVVAHSEPTRYGEVPDDPFLVRAQAAPGPLSRSSRRPGQPMLLELTGPIVTGPRWGTLAAGFSLARLEADLAQERWLIAAATFGFAALSWLALSLVLTRSILRRVQRLASAAAAFGRGELDQRVPADGADELAGLGAAFNRMADQLGAYTHSLEDKVEERATQIVAANRKLEELNAELSRAVKQLERLAITDGLTGLFNHRHFHETLAFELRRSARSDHPLSVIMIDVDHFKAYNDRNGHPAGDSVLRQLAEVFRQHLRAVDVVARYGGEEFAVLLLDTDTAGAVTAAEKIRTAVAACRFPIPDTAGWDAETGDREDRVTVSLGVASHPRHGRTPAEVLRAADRALYRAKAAGRNCTLAEGELEPRPALAGEAERGGEERDGAERGGEERDGAERGGAERGGEERSPAAGA